MRSVVLTALLVLAHGGGSLAQGPPPGSGQAPDSAEIISHLAEAAWDQNTKEGIQQAIRLYLRAADKYQQAGATEQQAEMLMNVAYLHTSLGNPDTALGQYYRLLRLLRENRHDALLGETLALIGEVYHGRGDLDSAVSYYHRALVTTRRAGDRANEGRALSDLGAAYKTIGRMDSSLNYLTGALKVRRELKDTLGEGVSLNNLGALLQILGEPDSALVCLRRALILRRASKDRAGEATTLNNIAYSFELLSQPDSALWFYREALPILESMGQRAREGLTLSNMGRVFLALEQADSALRYLNRGLAASRDGKDRVAEGWNLIDLGRLYRASGQPDTAVVLLSQALSVLRQAGDRAFEGEALFNLGTTYQSRARGRNLSAAVAYYDSAAAVRAEVGRYAGADAHRLSFAEQDVQLFEDWALAWLARGDEIGPDRAARAALAAAERGRAQALLDLMRQSSSSQAEAGKGTRAGTAAVRAGTDLAEEGSRLAESVARSGSAALFYLITSDTLLIWLVVPSGEVTLARQSIGRDSLAALVGGLRDGLGIDDVMDSEIAFRAIAALEAPKQRAAPRRGLRFAESAAQALGELLLPVELAKRLDPTVELVIVPQGPLALVPFSSLPLGRSEGVLVEPFGTTHPIRYAPSLAALGEAQARSKVSLGAGSLKGALVVGNPLMPTLSSFSGERIKLAPLPSSASEARWLARRLGTPALTAAAATEFAVRRRLPQASLIHLATHGYAFSSGAHARKSFVALAPGRGHDGVLSVGEVLDDPAVHLKAELVVLSACQTGLGDLKQAEGTVGLQRAFLAKGARSVLVSLWSVSDEVTQRLMQRFYTHWLDHRTRPSKAEALRLAQNDVRAMPGYQHPRFWAAFQLVGAR